MRIGFIGLGRMGGSMVERILRDSSHEVVGWNASPEPLARAASLGAVPAGSAADLVSRLDAPRHVWVMVPSGAPTQETVAELMELLEPGDMVIDGGNSRYTDSRRNGERAAAAGLEFLDVGVSGGIWGLDTGYCMMVGGSEEGVARLSPILDVLAPPDGWTRMGASGSGHYVKMIHNGVEYGMLQAYGEGFELMHASEFDLDLAAIAHLWNQGSVVRSWLCELAEQAFAQDGELERVRGWVEDSGEGRWAVFDAIEKDVPAPVLALSLIARFASRQDEAFSAKVIAALREQFGGHPPHTGREGHPAGGDAGR